MRDELVDEFLSTLPFRLDPFQQDAVHALAEGRSVLVAAPTGTGKTVVAEYAVHNALTRGLRAIYTTPIKALSNQKFRDFRTRYGSRVGLLTGDLVENPSGQLLVMTTEVARNMLVQDPGSFGDVGCLIFDEVHYLADPERGTAWEESILLAPAHVPLVCLSATIANAEEIAQWVRTTGREVSLIECFERSVPLHHLWYGDGVLRPLGEGTTAEVGTAVRRGVQRGSGRQIISRNGKLSRQQAEGETEHLAPEVVRALAASDLLPAIYFLFGRKAVEEAADACRKLSLLRPAEARDVRAVMRDRVQSLPSEDRSLLQVERLCELLPKGVGFHHAGMLPPLKTLVEELLADGSLKAVFATDTLALGINVPARSVVVGEMVKFDGQIRRPLLPGEYRQLTGRAGRRGMDPVGYSVFLPSPWVGVDAALGATTGEVAPLESAFRPGYSTLLNLWQRAEDEERLATLISGSLRQFREQTAIRELARERDEAVAALAAIPSGCPRDGGQINWLEQERKLKREGSAALAGSPCRSCPIRNDHRRWERQGRRYRGILASLDRNLAEARNDSRGKARRTLRAIRSVLEQFGYLRLGSPSLKAKALMRLFDSNSLVISELMDWGVLADASAPEVAEVASWFAFDREGSGRPLSTSERLARMRAAAETAARQVVEVERRFGVNLSNTLPTDFRGVALGWVNGASLADLASRSGLAEGDIVFALQKTIDVCRQIRQAAPFTRVASLARRAAEAERLLRRGVVDSYYRWVVDTEYGAKGYGSSESSVSP